MTKNSQTGVSNKGGPGLFFSLLLIGGALAVFLYFSHQPTATNESSEQDSQKKSGPITVEPQAVPVTAPQTKVERAQAQDNRPTPEDFKKIETLKQILASKNDNDPRLDSELKVLSPSARNLMRAEYKAMKAEQFNEKGTVVFLLGRNLDSPEDFNFLAEVLSETPCKSMEDCTKAAPVTKGDAAHEESVNNITMAYPQIVSLKAIERYLLTSPGGPMRNMALKDLKVAISSPVQLVSGEARNFAKKLRN